MHLACGLSVGFTGLAAGWAIGIVGDKGVRSFMQQNRVFVGMVLILIFAEVLGLYGYGGLGGMADLQAHCSAHSKHQSEGVVASRGATKRALTCSVHISREGVMHPCSTFVDITVTRSLPWPLTDTTVPAKQACQHSPAQHNPSVFWEYQRVIWRTILPSWQCNCRSKRHRLPNESRIRQILVPLLQSRLCSSLLVFMPDGLTSSAGSFRPAMALPRV